MEDEQKPKSDIEIDGDVVGCGCLIVLILMGIVAVLLGIGILRAVWHFAFG